MRVVQPMLEARRLPNLGALARDGVHGTIRSLFPLDSPPVWNSVVTGVSPKMHGIPSFAYKDAAGEKHLYLSSDRKVPALWNIVNWDDVADRFLLQPFRFDLKERRGNGRRYWGYAMYEILPML